MHYKINMRYKHINEFYLFFYLKLLRKCHYGIENLKVSASFYNLCSKKKNK